MFSEPHEQELLWLKFNIEDPFISKWVITESSYTFQGRHKPLYINDILSQERFSRFRDKIHIIYLDRNYNFEYEISFMQLLKRKVKRWLNRHRGKNYDFVPYAENASFHAERNQRQACVKYISDHFSLDDIVIACDADEIFDFNEGKIEIIEQLLQQYSRPFYIPRKIFCYDYDNLTNRLRFSPITRLSELVKCKDSMHAIRHPKPSERIIAHTDRLLAYEYTFCFSREAIMKKLSAFAHVTDLNELDVIFCLDNNMAIINQEHICAEYLKDTETFYTTIVLDSENAPQFLRDNQEHFKTHTVSTDYLQIRKANHIEQHN